MKKAILALFILSCNGDPATEIDLGPDPGTDQGGQAGSMDQSGQPGTDGPAGTRRRELKGGTRLKAKIVTGEDGSEAATGLFDTKLGVDCAFSEAEDGRVRCLPTELAGVSAFSPILGEVEDLFTDGNCTRRVAVSRLCSAPVKYVRFTESCGGRLRYAPVTEVNPPGSLYTLSGGMCKSATLVTGRYRYYAVGALVAPGEFVAGNVTLE